MKTSYDVVIIGGGASGMMASIFCAKRGLSTLIIDHNEKLGKKLYITGKGKCNLTNNSSIDNHLQNIVNNSKFMYSALNMFSAQDAIEFFESNGLPTRTERGKRVFPESNKSSDVIKTLEKQMHALGVKITLNTTITKIIKDGSVFNILCQDNICYTSNSVIVATGGLSYSGTGASGFGYDIATQFGHKIVSPVSALAPIVVKENIECLNGLSLKNVRLIVGLNKEIKTEIGEMLFTYNSLTGPIALTLSSLINRKDICNKKIYIDFKPALTEEQLEQKFLREFEQNAKKNLKTYLASILPLRFVDYFINKLKLNNKKVSEISKLERQTIIKGLKKFDFSIKTIDNINVAIVTSGGVDTKEINSKTMESKLCQNLYFVGEVLDVDALTGGYNLQIAWSTGYVAGNSVRR